MRVLRLPDIIGRTGLRRTSIYRGIREGWFPRPVPLGPRTVGWVESEIEDWLAERVASRDRRKSCHVA